MFIYNNYFLPNNMAANNTIGIMQFKSMRKPKITFPINAPPRPKVKDNAAAITLKQIVHNIETCWQKNVRR